MNSKTSQAIKTQNNVTSRSAQKKVCFISDTRYSYMFKETLDWMLKHQLFPHQKSDFVNSSSGREKHLRKGIAAKFFQIVEKEASWIDANHSMDEQETETYRKYLKDIDQLPFLIDREVGALAQQKDEGNEQAKQQLVEANLDLVVFIAQRYTGKGLPLMDLIQEGNIGLMEAVEKFDYRKSFKLSTYAASRVHQAIIRGVAGKSKIIPTSFYMEETIKNLKHIQRQLFYVLGREPTPKEIGQKMDISLQKVNDILCLMEPIESLYKLEESIKTNACIENKTFISPLEHALSQDRREKLKHILDILTNLEKKILSLCLGLKDNYSYTLEETGDVLGLTPLQVRQIQRKAIQKLRQPAQSNRVIDFLK